MGQLFRRPRPQAARGRAARAPGRGARLPQRGAQPGACSPRYYDGHPTIHGARPCIGRCRPGAVLTTELADGVTLRRGGHAGTSTERDLAAETIYRFAFGSLYRLQAVQRRPASRATTCSAPAATSRSSTSGWSSTSPRPRWTSSSDMIKAMVIERRPRPSSAGSSRTSACSRRACRFTDERGRRLLRPLLRVRAPRTPTTPSPPSTPPRPCGGSSTPAGPTATS